MKKLYLLLVLISHISITTASSRKKSKSITTASSRKKPRKIKPGKFFCPFQDCSYKAGYSSHLKEHLITHTKERLFMCGYLGCGKEFTTKSSAKRHYTTIHEKKRSMEEQRKDFYKLDNFIEDMPEAEILPGEFLARVFDKDEPEGGMGGSSELSDIDIHKRVKGIRAIGASKKRCVDLVASEELK